MMPSNPHDPYGWAGRILRVDLSRGVMTTQPTERYAPLVVGSRGIGQWILLEELDPGIAPFDPENIIVLGAGPLVATMAPASARVSIETMNPLTGGICFSNIGGHFGPELKFAGFDSVVLQGRAAEPSVLFITNGEAMLEAMPQFWGRTTFEVEDALRTHLGESDWHILSIGPAGETLSRGAALIGDRGRAAGRGGVGAVMGSKNLKAIAVKGSQPIRVAQPEAFMRHIREILSMIEGSPKMWQFREGGTTYVSGAGGPDYFRSQGVKNCRDEFWSLRKSSRVRETVFRKHYEVRRLACFNCPIYCSHFYRVEDGNYAGVACEGFQTNALRAFSSNLDIDNPAAVLNAHQLCMKLGIDVDMAAAVLGWSFDIFERGILTSEDTDGLELRWGNHAVIEPLLKQIACREGFGALLSDGVYRAAQKLGRGSERYALHIKGADVNEQGMRWNKSWSFGIVTSTRGGGHLDGAPEASFWGISPHLGRDAFGVETAGDPDSYAPNADLVVWHEKFKSVIDAVGLCYFLTYYQAIDTLGPKEIANLLSTATGVEMDADELMKIGERIHNLGKAFNTLHAGFTREDDQPPRRLVEEPIQSGPHNGKRLDLQEWQRMLDAYYLAHGWDPRSGWQRADRLEELDLGWVVEKLQAHGKLPRDAEGGCERRNPE